YTIDGCIDWLTGTAPDKMFFPLWKEVGAIQNNEFVYFDEYHRYTDTDGNTLIFYLDPKKLKEELMRHSPEDEKAIDELCGLLKLFKGFKPPVFKAVELMNFFDKLKLMPQMMRDGKIYKAYFKYGKISMADFADKFKSKIIRDMLRTTWGDGDMPMPLFLGTMAWCSNKTAGYPIGGSLKLSRDIEKRYLSLGGIVNYNKRVEKILIKDGKAIGIQLSDGSKLYADIIISASDIHSVIYNMLDGKCITSKQKEWFDNMPTFNPYIQVSFGINRNMDAQPHLIYQRLKDPIIIANEPTSYMIIHNYAFDKTLADEGKTSFAVRFFSKFEYWNELYKDKNKYNDVKAKLAHEVIDRLEQLYPGIADQIEVYDIATPATYVRYTNIYRGATMGFLPTKENFNQNLEKTIPGLENFYLIGQWLTPGGGLPNALKSARDAVQIICKIDKIKFKTQTPN
ncbi:MAG: NAD(P)/FAD-dependent oxidoreductase, partial [Eubacteriaceae bacterium]|nr:NAD(P)/FAD-dependent oxidoreductase [Eubacteriaceae bacterium]